MIRPHPQRTGASDQVIGFGFGAVVSGIHWAYKVWSSGVVTGVKFPQEKPDPSKVLEIAVQKEPGDAVLVPPEGFETIGWVVGRGDTYAEAEENLDETLRQVSVNIVRFDST